MNHYILYALIFILLLITEFFYLLIAGQYGIADVRNARSSHHGTVYKGGGVVFVFGAWLWGTFFGVAYPWLLAGLTLAAVVSMYDDIRPLSNGIRLLTHFAAASFALYQISLAIPGWSLWLFLPSVIIYAGIMNVYNFMDGINGMTDAYSLAVLLPLYLLNARCGAVDGTLLVVMMLAVVAFGFFNFRPQNRALCFPGDVGSISMGCIILFLLSAIIAHTGEVTLLLFLVVYGVDAFLTICHRIMLRENIGVAHRKHAYQIMANELHIGHLKIASGYAILQLAISLTYLYIIPDTAAAHWIYLGIVVALLSAGYLWFMKTYYHLHSSRNA